MVFTPTHSANLLPTLPTPLGYHRQDTLTQQASGSKRRKASKQKLYCAFADTTDASRQTTSRRPTSHLSYQIVSNIR